MKFLSVTLIAAAMLASSSLVAASDSFADVHAPALRRGMHHQKRTQCSKRTTNATKSDSKKSSKTSSHKKPHKSSSKSSSKSSKSKDHKSTDSDSTSSKSSSKSTGGSSGSGKKISLKSKQGLAWPNAGGLNIENFLIGGVSWFYSWGATPKWDSAPTDVLFCPMLWGDGGSGGNLDEWKSKVLNDPNGKYNKHKCMMGPNEVNQKGQSDMSVSDACSLMRKNMMPLADDGWYFIGPSTTSAPAGLTQWYTQFKSECSDVFNRFDAISLHWYDTNTEDFKKYVQNWHEKMGKPVWITEWACQSFTGHAQCSQSQTNSMMKEMSDWFLQQDYVVGFSPFGAMQSLQGVSSVNRLSQGSNPTDLFRIFANAS